MSREDIVAIASRLFAIFLFITAIRLGVAMLSAANAFSSSWSMALFLTAIFLPVVAVSAILWFFPLTVARKILPVMREPKHAVSPGSSTALELALTAIGFWVLSTALADAVYWLVVLVQAYNAPVTVDMDPAQKASLAATFAELALGTWFVFGSRGLANLVTRIRFAGALPS